MMDIEEEEKTGKEQSKKIKQIFKICRNKLKIKRMGEKP